MSKLMILEDSNEADDRKKVSEGETAKSRRGDRQ
jgi:hypothetical protein